MGRLQELYQWGHKTTKEYLAEQNALEQELKEIEPPQTQKGEVLDKLAAFLKDVSTAWKNADEEQRNRLAHQLFDAVWIKEQQVVAVTPRPELKPFFDLRYEGLSKYVLQWRPGSGSGHQDRLLRGGIYFPNRQGL